MLQSKILSLFWDDILGQEIPNLNDPYIQTTVLYDRDTSPVVQSSD